MMSKISTKGKKSTKINLELSQHEQIIKEQLESWIDDAKKAELEQRLKVVFENSKSHTQFLSQI